MQRLIEQEVFTQLDDIRDSNVSSNSLNYPVLQEIIDKVRASIPNICRYSVRNLRITVFGGILISFSNDSWIIYSNDGNCYVKRPSSRHSVPFITEEELIYNLEVLPVLES